jgi:hypothetical protein
MRLFLSLLLLIAPTATSLTEEVTALRGGKKDEETTVDDQRELQITVSSISYCGSSCTDPNAECIEVGDWHPWKRAGVPTMTCQCKGGFTGDIVYGRYCNKVEWGCPDSEHDGYTFFGYKDIKFYTLNPRDAQPDDNSGFASKCSDLGPNGSYCVAFNTNGEMKAYLPFDWRLGQGFTPICAAGQFCYCQGLYVKSNLLGRT